jgi:DNA-binding FrmR family transcriptional regulator
MTAHPGYADKRADHLRRLRKIEGQVRGLQRMIEEDRYCIDVLTQVASVTKALQGVGLGLLDEHLHHCVADAVRNDGGDVAMEEALDAVRRLLRS